MIADSPILSVLREATTKPMPPDIVPELVNWFVVAPLKLMVADPEPFVRVPPVREKSPRMLKLVVPVATTMLMVDTFDLLKLPVKLIVEDPVALKLTANGGEEEADEIFISPEILNIEVPVEFN
ncbi:MAG: hypothetical protein KF717_11975 [Cyclobacteriaceae bacterium]|nr:hypothetical protein [Cyclobacteriaceae bacterium]MCB9236626.1 hypothetical protein [Flammeovirgaceae bacterium]